MSNTSVVIVTRHVRPSLADCVASFAGTAAQLVIVLDAPPPGSAPLSAVITGAAPSVIISEQPVRAKARARNTGVGLATGEYVYFIDDDAVAFPGIIPLLEKTFHEHPEIDVIGGPNLTPPASSRFQAVAGALLASPFVAATMAHRYADGGRTHECDDREVILCNLAFRRRALVDAGYRFDERLHYNEENLLLQCMLREGRRILFCPDMRVYHQRRRGVRSFARQVFGSGYGRALMTVIAPRTLSPVHVMPALLVLAAATIPLGGGPVAIAAAMAYAGYVLVAGAFIVTGWVNKGLAMVLIPVAHISYGLGSVAGVAKGVWNRRR